MRNGICLKCGSDEIYKKKTGGQYAIAVGFWGTNFMIYTCADCGYCEQYIEGKRLPQIKTKWTPVNEKPKRKNDEG